MIATENELGRRRSTFYVPLIDSEGKAVEPNNTSLTRKTAAPKRIFSLIPKSNSHNNISLSSNLKCHVSLSQTSLNGRSLTTTTSSSSVSFQEVDESKAKSVTLPLNSTSRLSLGSDSSKTVVPKKLVFRSAEKQGRIGFNLIRRSQSSKLSRSSSFLKTFTARCTEPKSVDVCNPESKPPEKIADGEDAGVQSDTSYEKACRRGSAPSTPILGGSRAPTSGGSSSSRGAFANFFSKRSFRANPLKRTKSVTKLERGKNTPDGNDPNGLRTSRSHESLLAGSGGGRAVSQLELGSGGEVQAVHPSVLSRPHCFQLSLPPDGQPRFFSCSSQEECDKWVHSLRSCMAGNETPSSPRTDRSLRIWVLEAKGITSPGGKRRHSQPLRCEIYLDDNLWAKTAAKGCRSPEVGTNKGAKTELGTGAFWGELFDFAALPPIQMLKLKLLREPAKAQRNGTYKPTVIGTVQIPIRDISSRYFTEKWYPVDINDKPGREVPSLRVKCRFQAIHILPAAVYIDFLTFLKTDYKKICEILEPAIGVKAKEDIATALVLALQHESLAKPFLADVVMLDVERVDDQRLTFRGNSLATKAMEAYLKLTGDRYLRQTLVDVVDAVANADCEVDPLRVTGGASALAKQQRALRQAVELAWSRVLNSARIFPVELRECFAAFRERLSLAGRDDVADHLISASVFLRFLCPAILSPSLFNITNEYPNEKAARNLTLVAKTLQTLANFTRFQGKENFMEFMNDFLEREAPAMKQFLRDISTRTSDEDLRGLRRHSQLEFDGHIDLGKQLSILANLLSECLNKVSSSKLQELDPLTRILDDLHLQQRGGPMRSGSTPQSPDSLQNNIFRFNDPTVHNSNTNLNSSAATTPTSSPFEPQPLTPQLKPQLSQQYIHVPNTSEPTAIRSNTLPRNGHQVTLTIPGAELELEPARAFVSKSPCTPRRTGPNEQDLSQLSDLLRYADDSAKGSNVSISQLSNVASSGYQSFAYSQSSSPVDHPNGIHHRQNAHPRLGLKSQGLAFTNPVYSADFGPKRRLESSSSEERLSEVDKNKEEVNEKRRTPRTNPTVTYRKGYGVVSEPERRITPQRNESIEFDSHKNYICVARDVRNNGFEGPYFSRDLTDRNHRHENPHNIHPTPHDHSHNARWRLAHRRLSLDLTDSSSDGESNVTANAATRVFHTTGRVGSGAERYQREIERLQAAVDVLRRKLERAELGSSSPELEAHDSDAKMRSIIQRLISVEEELRREQHKMSLALSHKQRVIEAQEHQIAALDAANNRLLSALSTLKHRYTASSANQHIQSRTEDNDNGNNVSDVRTSSC